MTDRGNEGVGLSLEVGRWLSSVPKNFLIFSILLPWVSQALQILSIAIIQKWNGARDPSDFGFPTGSWKSCWSPPVAGWGDGVA